MCSRSKNSKVPVGEKSNICCAYGKTSVLKGGSFWQEKSIMYSMCRTVTFCLEGLKESGCHDQMFQMTSEKLVVIVKNVIFLEDMRGIRMQKFL